MSEKHTAEPCKEFIRSSGFQNIRCSRKATKDGFCHQHHPNTVRARDEERERRYQEEAKARKQRWAAQAVANKRRKVCLAFCGGFSTEALEATTLAEVVRVLDGTVAFIAAWGVTYQSRFGLEELHPNHAKALAEVQDLLSKLGDGQ